MRKTNTVRISEAIKEYLEQNQLDTRLKESNVKNYWANLMGNVIMQKTTNIYIRNKVLYISLNSSVLRNELKMMRTRIVHRMNEQMGGEYIEKVVLR